MPRKPRRAGRAASDRERRALAKANATPERPLRPAPDDHVVLTCDGGARGGQGAIGYVLDGKGHGEAIGRASAATAEYRAVLAGLRAARERGLDRVAVRSDSKLLVDHMCGRREPRNASLAGLGAQIRDETMRIGTVRFDWIPAAANGAAHALAAECLAGHAAGDAGEGRPAAADDVQPL